MFALSWRTRGVASGDRPLCCARNAVGVEGRGVKLIVGLGNPGLRYAHTRHNVGFDAVDVFAARHGWHFDTHRNRSQVANGMLGPEKVLLAKPQTYMNDSGMAVSELLRFYKLDPANDLLVICDDLDLPLAKVRLRPRGAAGGQHGLESTIRHIGTTNFARLKIGIGRPIHGRDQNVDFLLSKPLGDERITLDTAIERAADAVEVWLKDGPEIAMNQFNG
jgi:peptidyl-tRNA hydrolase, PTH1 family